MEKSSFFEEFYSWGWDRTLAYLPADIIFILTPSCHKIMICFE
jgi:hypothetical protein